MGSLVRLIRRPLRALRGWIIGPNTRQTADLRAETRELRRRVDELTSLLDDGLTTLGRTGQAVRSVERQLEAVESDPGAEPAAGDGRPDAGASAHSASVVIVTLNRADSLAECLRAVRGLDHAPFEVVVVNGPSSDRTAIMLESWRDRVKVVQCPVANIAAARNVGVAAAAGDVVAFLDDDTYPEPSWLGELLAGHDGTAVGVGGEVRNRAGTGVEFLHLVGTRLGETIRMGAQDPTRWYASPYSDRFPMLPGGNSAYRRDALVDIGGFDEAFEYGGEEGDVDIRLRDAGFGLRVVPTAVVYHQGLSNADRTPDGIVRDRYRFLRSQAYFSLKHAGQTHSEAEIAASYARSVERYRAERLAAVASGLLAAAAVGSLDDEAERAFADAATLWRARGPQLRPPEWFAAGSLPFLPLAASRPEAAKLHECFVVGPGVALPADLAREAEELAEAGNIVRIVRSIPGSGRVTIEAGVWRHDLAAADDGHPVAAGEAVSAEIRRIHATRPFTGIRPVDVPETWMPDLRSIGVPIAT